MQEKIDKLELLRQDLENKSNQKSQVDANKISDYESQLKEKNASLQAKEKENMKIAAELAASKLSERDLQYQV